MLEPNLISFNTVIAAYARVGDVDGVAQVLEGAPKRLLACKLLAQGMWLEAMWAEV